MRSAAPGGGVPRAPERPSPGYKPSPQPSPRGRKLSLGEGWNTCASPGEGYGQGGRLAVGLKVACIGAAIFLLALVPRLAALDAYVTIDESRWVQRSADFYALLAQRDPEDTFIIGHPGVTTMWTALLGMGPERALGFSFRAGRADATLRDGYFEALLAARVPFAVLAAAGVAAVTLLGWRLLGPGPALVGGTLLALEPFLVAHGRVVHLDSALTTYSTVCLLAALVFWQGGGGPGYLVLSGAAAGLAFLTKAPSVFVLGFVPLVAVAGWRGRRPRAWARPALLLLVWVLVAAAVALALWPALRANPVGTLFKMAQFTERVGGGEHDNFFLGSPLEDPGPLFYPLALLFRLSPLTLLGFALVPACWRWLASDQRRTTLTLGAYCLGFALMMSVAPKKFDRYLLPIFPVLGLMAGLGLWTVATRKVSMVPLLAGTLVLQAALLLSVHPYHLAYYNPVLGGGRRRSGSCSSAGARDSIKSPAISTGSRDCWARRPSQPPTIECSRPSSRGAPCRLSGSGWRTTWSRTSTRSSGAPTATRWRRTWTPPGRSSTSGSTGSSMLGSTEAPTTPPAGRSAPTSAGG